MAHSNLDGMNRLVTTLPRRRKRNWKVLLGVPVVASGLGIGAYMAAADGSSSVAQAQTTSPAPTATASTSRNDLGDLIVLSNIFGNGAGQSAFGTTSANGTVNPNNLSALIATDSLFRGSNTTGRNDLADLIVLSNVFGNGAGQSAFSGTSANGTVNPNNLSALIAVDSLFRNSQSGK